MHTAFAAWIGQPVVLQVALGDIKVPLRGKLLREGTGSNVLGHPLNALEWLVNNLSARGLGLKAGQYVTTGVTTEVYMAERGDRITADFGPVGSVQLEFG